MNLKEIYLSKDEPVISYEVFPPKDDTDGSKMEKLFSELEILKSHNPSVISVTYGAGGSVHNESVEIVNRIKNDLKITPLPHFTCVSMNKENVEKYLASLESRDIKNILALRGDIPENNNFYQDFKHASELVEYIKSKTNLSCAVAGYPEGHIESKSLDDDIKYLKLKVSKGADVIYTQLFFNNNKFYDFVQRCKDNDINVPIIPGIMPVTNYNSLCKMVSLCRVEVPKEMSEKIEQHKDDKDYILKYGIEYASNQCKDLIENNVKGLHFYTLNKSCAVNEILNNIKRAAK